MFSSFATHGTNTIDTMNLKNIKHAKGTGAKTDTPEPWTIKPFQHYFITMLKIFVAFIMVCWTTTCNFLNALNIVPNTDYPTNISKDEPNNKYCYGGKCMVANQNANDATALSQKTVGWMIKWWWQATQLAGYKAGGGVLNWYFTKTGSYAKPMAKDDSDSLMSFIKWLLFGVFTQFSMLFMFFLSFLISIPGYVQGLFSFSTYTSLIPNAVFRWIWSFLLFLLYSLITFWLGWVSFFPVVYECIHLLYLFFIKPIKDNADDFKNEFMNRMKYLITGFVIMAVIVAFMKLPSTAAWAIMGTVILVSLFLKKNSNAANADAD